MRVWILAQLAIMNPGAIEADRRADIRLKRSAKSEMPADTETGGAQPSFCNLTMRAQVVERGAAILIEFRYRSFRRVVQTAGASRIIKRNGGTWRFDAMVDLRLRHNKAVAGEPRARTQHRSGKLEDVGVKNHARKLAVRFWCGDIHSHGAVAGGNIDVFATNDQSRTRMCL